MSYCVGWKLQRLWHCLTSPFWAHNFVPSSSGIVFATLAYLRMMDILGSTLGLYFGMVSYAPELQLIIWSKHVTTSAWITQVHCLLQIIVSRICVFVFPATRVSLFETLDRFIELIKHSQLRLRLSVSILWTVIGISGPFFVIHSRILLTCYRLLHLDSWTDANQPLLREC